MKDVRELIKERGADAVRELVESAVPFESNGKPVGENPASRETVSEPPLSTVSCEGKATVDGPEQIDGKPAVELPCAGRPLGEFAAEMGPLLAGSGVYARGGVAFRVDTEGKRLEAVDPQWLRTWAETEIVCYKRGQDKSLRLKHSMSLDVAKALCVAPQFLDALPSLSRFQPVRMPVMREGGEIELLPAGYDEPTRTLTDTAGASFREDMSADDARAVLDELLGEFPFADERSRAVAVAAMVSVFAGGILPRGATVPAFIYMAQAEGAGKTTLAKLAGVPYGTAEARPAPTSEAEWQKRLLALVMSGRRLVILDNVRGHLNSPSLEAYLTATTYGDRILGVSKEFQGEADALVLITGNRLTVTPDLRRRALFCELFMRELRAEDRTFSRTLDDAAISALQADVLAALWTSVRLWDEAGRPPASRENSSFPRWCATVAGIVEHAGFGCPSEPAELETGGDTDTRDIVKLGESMEPWQELTFGELVELCDEHGLFERFTSQVDKEGSLTPRAKSAFGKMLATYHGRFIAEGLQFLVQGKGRGKRYLTTGTDGGNAQVA